MKFKNVVISLLTAIAYLESCLLVNHICYQIYISTVFAFGFTLLLTYYFDKKQVERTIERNRKKAEKMLLGKEEQTLKNCDLKKEGQA